MDTLVQMKNEPNISIIANYTVKYEIIDPTGERTFPVTGMTHNSVVILTKWDAKAQGFISVNSHLLDDLYSDAFVGDVVYDEFDRWGEPELEPADDDIKQAPFRTLHRSMRKMMTIFIFLIQRTKMIPMTARSRNWNLSMMNTLIKNKN
jgi:hypothetical protein